MIWCHTVVRCCKGKVIGCVCSSSSGNLGLNIGYKKYFQNVRRVDFFASFCQIGTMNTSNCEQNRTPKNDKQQKYAECKASTPGSSGMAAMYGTQWWKGGWGQNNQASVTDRQILLQGRTLEPTWHLYVSLRTEGSRIQGSQRLTRKERTRHSRARQPKKRGCWMLRVCEPSENNKERENRRQQDAES